MSKFKEYTVTMELITTRERIGRDYQGYYPETVEDIKKLNEIITKVPKIKEASLDSAPKVIYGESTYVNVFQWGDNSENVQLPLLTKKVEGLKVILKEKLRDPVRIVLNITVMI